MRRWVVFLLAALGGTYFDDLPARPIVMRGGWRVLEADLHVHSRFSDGFLSPLEIPVAARRQGLDAVAVTDHNTVFPSRIARWAASWTGGPLVITGEEITTSRHHVIALGLEETVAADKSLAATLIAVHQQRGVALAAHPGRKYWDAFDPLLGMLDGAEVMHPLTRRSEERGADLETFYARLAAARPNPAAIGSSDHHAMNGLGSVRTAVFVEDATQRGVLDALRVGRTVVTQDDGRMTGNAEMISLIEAEPLPRTERPSYVAGDLSDALLRTVGLLTLFALVFGRRPRLAM